MDAQRFDPAMKKVSLHRVQYGSASLTWFLQGKALTVFVPPKLAQDDDEEWQVPLPSPPPPTPSTANKRDVALNTQSDDLFHAMVCSPPRRLPSHIH